MTDDEEGASHIFFGKVAALIFRAITK